MIKLSLYRLENISLGPIHDKRTFYIFSLFRAKTFAGTFCPISMDPTIETIVVVPLFHFWMVASQLIMSAALVSTASRTPVSCYSLLRHPRYIQCVLSAIVPLSRIPKWSYPTAYWLPAWTNPKLVTKRKNKMKVRKILFLPDC